MQAHPHAEASGPTTTPSSSGRDELPPGVQLEDKPCPLGCERSDAVILEAGDRLHHIPGRFRVVQCRACGLARTNPRPTAGSISAYYPQDYSPHLTTPPHIKPMRWRHRAKQRVARFFGRDSRRLPVCKPGRLLEIGCAAGAYLIEMKLKGWSVEGIEFSDAAAARARAMGLQVQTATIEAAQAPVQLADVVAAWMVLEHLHDPVHALTKMRSWVAPNGCLAGVVPDFDAFDRAPFGEHWYALQLPSHLYHYTRRSLALVLERAGWYLESVRWQPNPNNLLNSMESWARSGGRTQMLKMTLWLKNSRRASTPRRWLGWVLGLTGQSGRMEFIARAQPHTGHTK